MIRLHTTIQAAAPTTTPTRRRPSTSSKTQATRVITAAQTSRKAHRHHPLHPAHPQTSLRRRRISLLLTKTMPRPFRVDQSNALTAVVQVWPDAGVAAAKAPYASRALTRTANRSSATSVALAATAQGNANVPSATAKACVRISFHIQ